MVAVVAAPTPVFQFFDNAGNPAAGGFLLTQVGQVNYPTYQDYLGTTALPNPIPLNSRGEVSSAAGASAQLFVVANQVYSFTLFDANGNQLWSVPYINGVQIPASTIGAFLYPILASEGSTVTAIYYPYGDIRRYGAATSATDNSAAINAALAACAAGGFAAFIPPGTWNITSTINATLSCSMYGSGQDAVINASGCDALTFSAQTFYGASRYFRDFVLTGSSTTSSIYNGINITLGSGKVTGVQFSNLTIENFAKAVLINSATGLWNSAFMDCFLYNNYQGYYFNGQAVSVLIRGGFVQCGSMAGNATSGNGTRYGIYTNANGGGDVQALNVSGVGIYAYDIGALLGFTLYTTITDCNFNIFNVTGIELLAAQGGTFIKGCWIQGASNTSNLIGIQISDLNTAINDKIVIDGCQLLGQGGAGSASTGIYCGENNTAISILNSTIGTATAPFANGVSGISGYIQTPNVVIRYNTFYVSGTAVLIGNAAAVNCDVGPNVTQSGTPVAFSAGTGGATPAGFRYAAAGMSGSQSFSASTSAAVTFTGAAMPNASYIVTLSGNSAGFAWVTSKATTGFTIDCNGTSSAATDWRISYS